MPINDLYRAVFSYTYQGVVCNNVFYFRAKANNLTAQILADNINDDWRTFWRATSVTSSVLTSVYTYKVSDNSGENGYFFYTQFNEGTAAGDGIPRILAAVFSLRTALFGRSNRGRFYHTGWPVSWLTNGTINSTGMTNLSNSLSVLFSKYKVGGNSSSWEMGVYSKVKGGYNIPFSLAGFTGYTTYTVNPSPGTERGRKA